MTDYSYYDALLRYCELRCGIYSKKKNAESEKAGVYYSYYDSLLRYLELRYNHNHDSKGRFCSGSGEGGSSAETLDKSAESSIIKNEEKTPVIINMQFFANKNISKMNDNQLRKSVSSWNARIQEHKDKIRDPHNNCDNWEILSEQHRKGLLRHWKKEIENMSKDVQEAEAELRKRGK